MRRIFISIGIALFLFFIGSEAAVSQAAAASGEDLYKKQCAVCHGADGKGNGLAADFLFPKPRNFTTGSFKVRSTPSGSFPTDQDLLRTINDGMPGSAMPSFANLSRTDQQALVDYIKKLANIEKPERVISIPSEPSVTSKMLAQGKELYKQMKCWECHGIEGRGDGPKAKTQLDDWGFPAPPNDFSRGIYKGGGRPSDIYLRFTTGLDGSPMASFEESLNEAERWAVVHYVKSLAGSRVAVQPTTGTIVAKKLSGPLPKDALDPQWDNVPITTIPLMHLLQGEKGADAVSVQVVHNGRDIAFLLEWEDWGVNSSFISDDDFSDAAAIMFSLSPKGPLSKQPHFTMGEKGGPVNIWQWRLNRQMDMARPQVASHSAPDPIFAATLVSSNVVSKPMRPPSAVEDLNAEGFGTLTAQPQWDQNVNGVGHHVAGQWKVVFIRKLSAEEPSDVMFKKGGTFPLAFAVWDGSKEERDGKKAITTWYTLELK